MQPQLDAVVRGLGLRTFHQPEAGLMVFEQSATAPIRRIDGQSREVSSALRIEGGMAALVDAVAAQVPADKVHMGHCVRRIERLDDGVTLVESVNQKGEVHRVLTQNVLLALPPRLAIERVEFEPPLPTTLVREWTDCPTWMAPHAKYVAVYSKPFWREQGLAGSGRSYVGPMVEIHDASPAEGVGALFGFIGVPATTRQRVPADTLISLCRAQMVRLFGANASNPSAEWLKDWSQDEFTGTRADAASAAGHANAPLSAPTGAPWHGRITGIASEWSPLFPGYVAGAIDAASRGTQAMVAILLEPHSPPLGPKKAAPVPRGRKTLE